MTNISFFSYKVFIVCEVNYANQGIRKAKIEKALDFPHYFRHSLYFILLKMNLNFLSVPPQPLGMFENKDPKGV